MDEVHIILGIYMDEEGITVLISMSQYTNGDQGSKYWESVNTYKWKYIMVASMGG